MQRARLLRPLGWLFVCCSASPQARAQSQDTDVCIHAHESAQTFEHAGRLRAARQDYIQCAQASCPAVLRSDCSDRVQQLTGSIPSVVVRARDGDGADVLDATVYVDGELVARSLDGRAFELDPGRHVLRCAAARGPVVEKPFAVLEGGKNQLVEVTLGLPSRDATPQSRPPYLAYGLGALGLVAVGGFAYFGLTGAAKERDLDKCAPLCDLSDYRAMRRDYLVGDISLGVGVLLFAVSTYIFVTHDSKPSPAVGKGR